MPQRPNERVDKVPREACRFAATFDMQPAGDAKTVAFSSLARTVDPVDHWYWGQCVHDFAGMRAPAVMPVDYCHDQDEALGMINKTEVTADGLHMSGVLMPYQEGDRASEVVHKAALGMPYQASIDFDEHEIVLEDIPAGFSGEANGRTYQGPVAIFRQWNLYGLAVCLRGVDEGTNVQFSRKLSGQTAAVTRFSKGAEIMPEPTPAPTTPATPVAEPEATVTTPVATTVAPAVTPATTTTVTAPATATQLSHAERATAFKKEFGDVHGVALFAKHERIEDARGEFSQIMLKENEALKGQVAKFAKGPQGETPVSFSGADTSKGAPGKFANLGPNLGAFAASIRIPGKKYD